MWCCVGKRRRGTSDLCSLSVLGVVDMRKERLQSSLVVPWDPCILCGFLWSYRSGGSEDQQPLWHIPQLSFIKKCLPQQPLLEMDSVVRSSTLCSTKVPVEVRVFVCVLAAEKALGDRRLGCFWFLWLVLNVHYGKG